MPALRLRPLSFQAGLLLATWFLASSRSSRAENSVAYKYEEYRESGGRIAVETHGAQWDQDVTPDLHLKLSGVIDAITGATPTGQPIADGGSQVPLTSMHDRRKAWDINLANQFSRINIGLDYANSRESDYTSNGLALNTLTDFNAKNTVLLLGVAANDDDVERFAPTRFWDKKRGRDVIAGVTQLLDPLTSVTANVSWGRETGFLSDPYRLVSHDFELLGVVRPFVFPENRPAARDKWTLLAGINRAFPAMNAAIDASYRFYHDTFGTNAHTFELAWLQKLGEHFILEPSARYYTQSAAGFYHYNLNLDGVPLQLANEQAPGLYYSSDYRLSRLHTTSLGLKGTWILTSHWQLDAAFEDYAMRGADHVTPQSAYPHARIVTVGAKFSW